MTNPGSDFGLEGLRRPGETRRDFGPPKNHCFRLHAYVSMVKLPENDESGFRFWVGGTHGDPERPGDILGSQKTIVLGFMHMFLW
jgi:hypothetical protein